MQRIHDAAAFLRRSDTPAQREIDHAGLTDDIRQRFADLIRLLEQQAVDLGRRMADVGQIEVVNHGEYACILFCPDRAEGIHSLVGSFELRLTHTGKAAIHMRIRNVVPPVEVLDFDRVTAERLEARLRVFEGDCRRLPPACATA
ncbi:MAG TPA: hypothetical protein VD978_30525 [Azospirillum sp.]|nr:hypothetical protein [Azospirillum sp.]